MSYIEDVLLGLDEFANTLTGGQPGDTISHRAAVARNNGERWGCWLCAFLNLFQADHCDKTIAAYDAQVESEDAALKQESGAP